MVRESEFKSEDPVFNPLVGQDEGQLLRVNSCADLFVPEPPHLCACYRSHIPHLSYGLLDLKQSINQTASIIKDEASQPMETRKHCTQGKKKNAG